LYGSPGHYRSDLLAIFERLSLHVLQTQAILYLKTKTGWFWAQQGVAIYVPLYRGIGEQSAAKNALGRNPKAF
jgi:hypothetical protein